MVEDLVRPVFPHRHSPPVLISFNTCLLGNRESGSWYIHKVLDIICWKSQRTLVSESRCWIIYILKKVFYIFWKCKSRLSGITPPPIYKPFSQVINRFNRLRLSIPLHNESRIRNATRSFQDLCRYPQSFEDNSWSTERLLVWSMVPICLLSGG